MGLFQPQKTIKAFLALAETTETVVRQGHASARCGVGASGYACEAGGMGPSDLRGFKVVCFVSFSSSSSCLYIYIYINKNNIIYIYILNGRFRVGLYIYIYIMVGLG